MPELLLRKKYLEVIILILKKYFLECENIQIFILIMSKHIVEGVSQLISNLLDLQLLSVDLVLDVVNPLVELGDVHLSVLEPSLGDLVLVLDAQDLLLQLLLSLHGLLSAELELLHVLAHHLELLLDVLQFALSQLGPLDGSLKFLLLDSELPGQLVELLLVVGGHLGSLPQVFVQLLDGDLVVHALALNNLDFLQDLIGLLGGQGKLGDGVGEVDLGLLGLLLHQHDPTAKSSNISFHLFVHFVLLLKALISLVKFVSGLVKFNLKSVNFLSIISDVAFSLVENLIGLLGVLLELPDDGVELVSLVLQGLHLLPDGVHCVVVVESERRTPIVVEV